MWSRILGQRPKSLKQSTFCVVLPRNTLTLFLEKGHFWVKFLQGAASDYRTLTSFALFLGNYDHFKDLIAGSTDEKYRTTNICFSPITREMLIELLPTSKPSSILPILGQWSFSVTPENRKKTAGSLFSGAMEREI